MRQSSIGVIDLRSKKHLFDLNVWDSYKWPLIKLVSTILLLLLLFLGADIVPIQPLIWFLTYRVFVFLLCACSIRIIYISIAELCFVYRTKNKNGGKKRQKKCLPKTFETKDIIDKVIKSDIIDIVILMNSVEMKIGASSNYDTKKCCFFDKLYYIDHCVYSASEDFAGNLHKICGTKITVLIIE